MHLSCTPLLRAWPATQACALTGNWTRDPLVCSPALNTLSRTSQGWIGYFFQHFEDTIPLSSGLPINSGGGGSQSRLVTFHEICLLSLVAFEIFTLTLVFSNFAFGDIVSLLISLIYIMLLLCICASLVLKNYRPFCQMLLLFCSLMEFQVTIYWVA